MAKYILTVHPIVKEGDRRPKITDSCSPLGMEYLHLRPYEEKGYRFLYVQYTNILLVNGKPIPEEWIVRKAGRTDVLIVRGDLSAKDFDVAYAGGIY